MADRDRRLHDSPPFPPGLGRARNDIVQVALGAFGGPLPRVRLGELPGCGAQPIDQRRLV